MATIDFAKTKTFTSAMSRNIQGVAIKSDDITGSCTVTLDFGIKGTWFAAESNGEAITADLTTGTATGIGFVWEAAPDLGYRLNFGSGISGSCVVETLY